MIKRKVAPSSRSIADFIRISPTFVILLILGLTFGRTQNASAQPANDNFANAQTITGLSGSVTGTNVNATRETGEPVVTGALPTGLSVWYKWIAPANGSTTIDTIGSNFDTVLGVYTGSTVSALSKIDDNDDDGSNFTSKVVFNANGGTTYYILVAGYNVARVGNIVLNWSFAGPANDNFANAQAIIGQSGSVVSNNVNATRETGEPAPFGTDGLSVWYKFTAPSNGSLIIDTVGSNFDTILGVYTGNTLSELNLVIQNDDYSGIGTLSKVIFNAESGTTYYILVAGYRAANTGNIVLNWGFYTPPANDNFADAEAITGSFGSVTGNNIAATREPGEPTPIGGLNPGQSVWYKWIAPQSGSTAFDTVGSDFDTVLGVYTGSSVSALTVIAQNDDYPGLDPLSKVIFNAENGTMYYVLVSGYSITSTGHFLLNWAPASTSKVDDWSVY